MKQFILFIAVFMLPLSPTADTLETCCRYCTQNSKPCGNSCIPLAWNCKKGEGCACSAANPRPGQGVIYQQGFSDGYSLRWNETQQAQQAMKKQQEQALRQALLDGYQLALYSIKSKLQSLPATRYDKNELLMLIDGFAHASSVLMDE